MLMDNTSRSSVHRVISALFAAHWAIEPSAFDTLVEIVHRANVFDPETLLTRNPQRLEGARYTGIVDGVAVIPIFGPIVPRASMFSEISGATSVDILARDFGTALREPSVRAIVLNIDSPGGAVTGVDALAQTIRDARGKKRITAFVTGQAASAAYWVASAADEIVASPAALLGSIGVVATFAKSDGKTVQIVSSQSPNKRPDVESEAGRAEVQKLVDAVGQVFVDSVAENRAISPANVIERFGRGRMWVAASAVAVGMADRVGMLEEVIARLRAGMGAAAPTVPSPAKAMEQRAVIAAAADLMKTHPGTALKARWLADRRLRDEFGTFGAFEAYERAAERGKVSLIRDRTLKGKPSRGPRPL